MQSLARKANVVCLSTHREYQGGIYGDAEEQEQSGYAEGHHRAYHEDGTNSGV